MLGYPIDVEIQRRIMMDTVLILQGLLIEERNEEAKHQGANTVGLMKANDILQKYKDKLNYHGR